MPDPIAGFYACYFASDDSYGAGMFAAQDGTIVGVDLNGVELDGSYVKEPNGYVATVTVKAPAGTDMVQGMKAGPDGLMYDLSFRFRQSLQEDPFIRVDTVLGPINVRFQKLRPLNDRT